MEEGAVLQIVGREQPWSEDDWLSLGHCSNATFYWSDERHAVLAYESAEFTYFVDSPKFWTGAHVSLCNKSERDCPAAASIIKALPGCNDHSL